MISLMSNVKTHKITLQVVYAHIYDKNINTWTQWEHTLLLESGQG